MKKNRLKKTLAILLSVVMAQGIVSTTTVSTFAVDTQVVELQTSDESDWGYRNEGEYIRITDYNGIDSEVVIPSIIDNLPVTEIESAFWLLSNITSITLPEGLTRIGCMAFSCCDDLEYINIPSTVTIIEDQAFVDCPKLKSNLVIPNGVSILEARSFSTLYEVPSILVPDSVTSINKTTFKFNDGPVVYYSSKNTAMKEFAEQYGGTNYLKDYKEFALDKTSMNIEAGGEYTLTSNLNSEDVIKKCTWSTSNENVATVDQNGKVTSINNGTTIITMTTENDLTASCKVVVGTSPESITLSKSNLILNPGVKYALKTTMTPSNATTIYTWTSSDESVATVSNSGNITTVGKGTATITVTTANGKTASCDVTVKKLAKSVKLDRTSVTLTPGQVWKLKPSVTPISADVKYAWRSSDESVAKVSIYGNITAVGTGTATITVKTNTGKIASCEVTVLKLPEDATIKQTSITLEMPKRGTKHYSLAPYATTTGYTWTSSDENIVTINNYGNMTLLAEGTVTITATASNGTKAICEVIIVNPYS